VTGTVVVDSSAIVCIFKKEPEVAAMLAALDASERRVCSAVTFVETFIVTANFRPGLDVARFSAMVADLEIDIVDADAVQAHLAAEAFLRFGKGRHPAKLNFGDCLSYALAKALNAPLLFKGDDFPSTDIVSALAVEKGRP